MNLLKKIKVELWVLFFAGFLSLLLAISTGILVRQELVGSAKLGVISQAALFLADIPANLKLMIIGDLVTKEQRFTNISGFHGSTIEEEAYLLLSKYDGNKDKYLFHDGRSVVELVDLRSFEVKKTWRPDMDQINALVDNLPEFENLKRDKNAKRYRLWHPFLTEDGGLIFQDNSPLVKIDKNSQLVWQNQVDHFHHSIEQDHEGNFWVPTNIYPYQVDKRYVGLKRDTYNDDAITKVSPDGDILFQKSVSNIFIENNLGFLLFPITGFYTNDPIHLNDIQPVLTDGPYWKRGDVFLSLRNQSMIVLYRPSTNKIIWKGVGHTIQQHDVDILDDHRISIFNNNLYLFHDGQKVDGSNEIIVYDFKIDSYSKYLDESLKQYDVRSTENGRGQILGNGDLFIEETDSGRLLYFNKDTSVQWQYVNRADNGNVYKVKWSRILYKPEDIKKVRKIIEAEN
mgnify:CR=1 FL=1|jgi:hypothetical protein